MHERDIHDGIRYTFSLDEPAYTAGVARVHDQLTKLGYELERQTNSWDGAGYKGVNSCWVEPHSGELIEVQFHTPVSSRVNKSTRRLRGDREPHDRSLHPSPPPGVATTGGRDHRDPTRSGRHPGSSEGRAMSQPDERHEQDEPQETRYYAVVSPSRTRENPSGLARRRFTPEGPVDESLLRNFTWTWSPVIYVRENGDVGQDLFEITEAEANEIIERFRSRWAAADQS
jgi:hypothetical protein